MAVASSYREASSQVRQRARPTPTVASTRWYLGGHTVGTAREKWEEGVGHGRSVCPESSGPHAGYNGRDRGQPTSREEGNP